MFLFKFRNEEYNKVIYSKQAVAKCYKKMLQDYFEENRLLEIHLRLIIHWANF